MAYRAEIEIGVKGARKLEQLQTRINKLAEKITDINDASIFDPVDPRLIQSVKNYSNALDVAAENLKNVEIGQKEERDAVKAYVQALGESNEARARQNQLIDQQIAKQTAANRVIRAASTGFSAQRYGPQVPTGSGRQGDPEFPSSPVAERLARQLQANKDIQTVKEHLGKLEEESVRAHNHKLDLQADYLSLLQRTTNAAKFRAQQAPTQLALPAFQERGLKLLDNSVKAKESELRIEQALNGQRSRGVRFAEKRAQEEARLLDLGITGLRTKQLTGTATRQIAKDTSQSAQNVRDEVAHQTRLNRLRRVKQGRKAQERTRAGISNAIIGGAFPLLFGQGPLAAAGGAIGGFAGGQLGGQFGFGLSLVGTQIGATVNQIIQSTSELGQALNPVTGDIDAIAEAAGFAGTETELYIKAIEKNAGKQAALKAATEELAAVVGQEGVAALQQFGEATRSIGNSFARIFTELQAGIAKLAAGPTEDLARSLERSAALRAGLGRTEGEFGALNKRRRDLVATIGKGTSAEQIATNREIRDINEQIIRLEQQKTRERQKNLQITERIQKKLQEIESQRGQVQTRLEILDIIQQASTADTEAADIRKRATEFVARQEQRIASLRLSLEQQISSIRLQNLSKEAQLRNTQDKLELARLRNRLTQASQSFAASMKLDQPGRDFAISLNKAAADFNLALAAANNERAANDRSNALELEQLSVRAEQTKANVRRQVAKLQADFDKQSAELNQKVADYNRKVSTERFNLEKEITKLRLTTLENELALERLKLENAKNISEQQKTTFDQIQKGIETARLALNEQAAPETIGPLDLGTAGGVSTEAFDAVIEESRSLIQKLSEARGQLIDEEVVGQALKFADSITKSTQALVQQETPLDTRLKTMERTAEVARLVAEGFSQADATAIVEGTQAFANLNEELRTAKTNLENKLEQFTKLKEDVPEVIPVIEALEKALADVNKQLGTNTNGLNNFVNSFQKTNKIKDYMDRLKEELGDTQGMIVSLAQTIEGEMASAMSNAITNVITGTGTVQEAMSTMFTNIGKAFIDMATQMIAKALILKALGILFPGAGATSAAANTGPQSAAVSAGWPGNLNYENGGAVRPNGTYLVGERGPELLSLGNQPGYVHRNTSEVMDRYRGGGSGGSAASNVSVNYNVTEINEMRFVTEEQFRAGMTQAARDGARRGEASTFRTLRNSRSNRARVGL